MNTSTSVLKAHDNNNIYFLFSYSLKYFWCGVCLHLTPLHGSDKDQTEGPLLLSIFLNIQNTQNTQGIKWTQQHDSCSLSKYILKLMFTFKNTFVINFIYIVKYISKYSCSHNKMKNSHFTLLAHFRTRISPKYYSYYCTLLKSPSLCYILHQRHMIYFFFTGLCFP